MKTEYKIEEIDPVADIKNKVIQLLDVFNGPTDMSHFSMILYLLTLQKEGILQQCNLSMPDLNIDISLTLDELESNNYEVYKKINDDYYYVALGSLNDREILEIGKVISNLDQKILEKYFSSIFEDLIYTFSKIQGRISGESLMPMELCRFMSGLSELPVKAKIYNPFAGLASFGVFLDEGQNYFGQEENKSTWALGGLRLAANDRSGITTFSNDDSILYWPSNDEKFDLIISNPPFGLLKKAYKNLYPSITTFEQFVIEKSISSLKDTGKLITVVPHGFLFRGGAEKKTREFLIKADLIESIISIPGGLYSNTLIPVVVLVINKSKKEKGIIRFIDANNCVENSNKREKKLNDYALTSIAKSSKETDSLRLVSNAAVISNDYNLNVSRYFKKEFKGVKISELVKEITGQKTKSKTGKLIQIKDLKEHKFDYNLDLNSIELNLITETTQEISESCLLIALKGDKLKPTFFEFTSESIYLKNDIIALKVDEKKVDLNFFINELYSDYVEEQVGYFKTGSIVPKIRLIDLLEIKIDVLVPDYRPSTITSTLSAIAGVTLGPLGSIIGGAIALKHYLSLKEQKIKIQGIRGEYNKYQALKLIKEDEIVNLKEESFREFASIKHTFRQYLNALKSNVAGTRLFVLNNQENGVTLDTIYSKNLNKSFGEHLLGLEGTIESMSRLLTSFESSTVATNVKEHDLKQLAEEAQNRFKNSELFQFEKLYFDQNSFAFEDGDGFRAPKISIDEDDFYRIFSNIVSNAIDHGFKDISKKYSIRTAIIYDQKESMCILEVSNNGKAMPKDFTLKELTTSGEKTTDSRGTGMGGADIKNILKKYNGTLDMINDQTQEFPVTYIVKLPIFSINY